MKKGKQDKKAEKWKQLTIDVSESRIVVIACHVLSLLSHKIEAHVSTQKIPIHRSFQERLVS